MREKLRNRKGFTLSELLIVVAIVAVLVAVSIPVFTSQLEKSRNAVDEHTAKTIADAIAIYYVSNPDACLELQETCDVVGSQHCIQIEVMSTNTTIHPLLQPALKEAGLINTINTNSTARFTEITSKSKENWVGYRVVVSNYNNMKPGEITIHFWGLPVGTSKHSSNSWGQYIKTDPTGFRDIMESLN